MKKIFKLTTFFLIFILLVISVVLLLPDQYNTAYQRAIVNQYRYYEKLEGNKIVFVGNSSLSYGLDLDYMEELTGEQCAILGNHAGYGMSFVLEMSKSNLVPGDKVVVEIVGNTIDYCGESLLLTGIGKNYDMYKFFIPQVRKKIIEYYPTYIKESLSYFLNGGYKATGSYSMESYDNRGNMIYNRPQCEIPEPYDDEVAKTYSWVYFSGDNYDKEWVDYINEYIKYCNKMNVEVFFTIVPYLNEAVKSSATEIDAYDEMIRNNINAPLISNSKDYIFTRDYIYNAIAHCNTIGAKHRTKLLFDDLMKYIENNHEK